MISVSDPWAAAADGVPGALPDGVYVRVEDDGRELACVRLDAEGGPRWVSEDEAGWHEGELVSESPPMLPGMTAAAFAAAIALAQTKGISPFGDCS